MSKKGNTIISSTVAPTENENVTIRSILKARYRGLKDLYSDDILMDTVVDGIKKHLHAVRYALHEKEF